MRDEQLEAEGRQLSEAIDAERETAGPPPRWHCSLGLRARVVAHALACTADRESHTSIARRLGILQTTLSRWIREAKGAGEGEFRPVAIVPSERRSSPRPQPAVLRLVTPRGFVVEGLDAELLAALLRVLG